MCGVALTKLRATNGRPGCAITSTSAFCLAQRSANTPVQAPAGRQATTHLSRTVQAWGWRWAVPVCSRCSWCSVVLDFAEPAAAGDTTRRSMHLTHTTNAAQCNSQVAPHLLRLLEWDVPLLGRRQGKREGVVSIAVAAVTGAAALYCCCCEGVLSTVAAVAAVAAVTGAPALCCCWGVGGCGAWPTF